MVHYAWIILDSSDPNPTVSAIRGYWIRGHERYRPNKDNSIPFTTLVTNQAQVIEELRRVAPFGFQLTTEDIKNDAVARKQVEDQFDALVCLYVASLVFTQDVRAFPGGGLFTAGGIGMEAGKGGILTPLSELQVRELGRSGLLSRLVPVPEDGETVQEHIPKCEPTPRRPTLVPSDEQLQIIQCEDRVVRVIARAGTGKTTTMVWRAKAIIENDPRARVLMLTFTRNAAREMNKKLEEEFPDARQAACCHADTYHGFAFRTLLGFAGNADGWRIKQCSLLNEMGRESVLDYLIKLNGWSLNPKNLTQAVNSVHPVGTPDELLRDTPFNDVWRKILAFYRKEGLLDFDVIMVLNEYLLRTDPVYRQASTIRQTTGPMPSFFTHIIADEFQDTNRPQLESLLHLSGLSSGNSSMTVEQLMVIGDDFQTVYTFRGAVVAIFQDVIKAAEKAGSDHVTLPLTGNRRSRPPIVNYANHVAAELSTVDTHKEICDIVGYLLRPTRPEDQSALRIECAPDVVAAAKALLEDLIPGEDIVVLAWGNKTLAEDLESLNIAGIPAALITAQPTEMMGLRRFHAALVIAMKENRRDLAAWWEIARAAGVAAEDFDTLWAAGGGRERLTSLGSLGKQIAESLAGGGGNVRTREGLCNYLEAMIKADPQMALDKDMCVRLIDAFVSDPNAQADPLRTLSEMTRRDFAGGRGKDGVIRLCTVHGFKGLQRKAVIIHNDGFMGTNDPEKMRLDYVARTRAEDRLIVVDGPADIESEETTMPR
ncbi:MAG: ATP-dependent helicase, partial [Planctomycetota bacterium]